MVRREGRDGLSIDVHEPATLSRHFVRSASASYIDESAIVDAYEDMVEGGLVLCEPDQCAPGQTLQRESHAVALAHPEGQKRPVVEDGGFNDVSAIVRRLKVEELGHAGRLNR